MPTQQPQSLREIFKQLAPDATDDDLDETEVNLRRYVRAMYTAYTRYQQKDLSLNETLHASRADS